MDKQKLLYVSPFPPLKSGISDYSEILVYALKDYYDITLLIDTYDLENETMYQDFEVIAYGSKDIDFQDYKYIIYNIGNNPYFHSYIYELCLKHPGIVILHDCVLYYLIAGYYEAHGQALSKIYEIGGATAISIIKNAMKKEKKGLLEYKDIASLLPLNRELAESGNKIMVHSEYARNMILSHRIAPESVRKINMIKQTKENTLLMDRHTLFAEYGIPEDAIIVTSFGYIAETKLNHLVCLAVERIAQKQNIRVCYVMVGEGTFADKYVDNRLVFKTGYVDLDHFNSFLAFSDIVSNLRYPSMGETSAAMIRIMEYGKPCVIISDAWFAELPEDCVVSLKADELEFLEEKLEYLIVNERYRQKVGIRAKEYVDRFCSADIVCEEIRQFLME